MAGLAFQQVNFPLAAGLNTKQDVRAKQAPYLDIATDVLFDEIGGVQTRLPFAGMSTAILGGGTIADPRRLAVNGDELLLFTKDHLYSWVAEAAAWALKADYPAVALDERTVFARTADQVGCDRAELGGVVLFAWQEAITGGSVVRIGAQDKATGATLISATTPTGAASAPRLVALATRVLLFFLTAGGALSVLAIDPANLTTSLAGAATALVASGANDHYDATRMLGADTAVFVARMTPTTGYTIGTVPASLTGISTALIGNTCTGAIACSSAPGGNNLVQVARSTNAAVLGDLIDVSVMGILQVGQAIGATAGRAQIAAAHRSVADGSGYRCYVWWTDAPSDTVAFDLRTNWVDTVNALGAESRLAANLDVGSRAFDVAGRVFVWTSYAMTSGVTYGQQAGFKSQLQNGYFLYRDDGLLCGKAARSQAGGYQAAGHLPGVQDLGGGAFAWCGSERRVIPLGKQSSGYSAHSPREITFQFDADDARRCVRLGETLYITGAETLQYDGVGLYEVGFHVIPSTVVAAAISGSAIADGTYAYKASYRWDNARGELERSTALTVAQVALAAPNNRTLFSCDSLYISHKRGRAPAIEVWRTQKNPIDESPFFLITSNDPNNVGIGVDNAYLNSDVSSTVTDNLADADATLRTPNPENGEVLESLAPPPARIIFATQDRVFLAGIAGAPNTVWYSRQRAAGDIASFNDELAFDVPATGGAITAIGYLGELPVVFCERAVYTVPGIGNDNAGGGQNFGPAQLVSTDVGALNADAVVLTPAGLIFKSLKGWYLLGQGAQLQYIGDKVNAFDAETIVAIDVVESKHQIRAVSAQRVLLFDYVAGQWATWSIAGALDAATWKGTYTLLGTAGPALELADFSGGVAYGMDVESSWIKWADLQGFARVRYLMVLGEFRSPFRLRVRIARDYKYDDTGAPLYFQDVTWTPDDQVAGTKLQLRISPRLQQCEAMKVRLTVLAPEGGGLGEACKLTGLGFSVGMKNPLYGRLPATAKE